MYDSILFLCTGNSCRSQMAEGFAKVMAPAGTKIYSAGMNPSYLNRRAELVMKEEGFDISEHYPKGLDDIPVEEIDLLITLCDDARARCPSFPRQIEEIHWPLEDPYFATGSDEAILAVFRKVRDEIRERLETLFAAASD